jgi:lipopolysaccharide export system protein LptA
MKFRRSSLFLACVLTLVSPWVAAENADKSKPMNIEADSLRYDDARQISVFTGRVVITKGTIVIRGQQVEVRQDAQGNQFGVVTASSAEPAFFRQKREGVDEFIEGDAQTIEYDGRADTVRFLQKAQLRRYRGATLADQISGAVIVYDNTKDMFTVDGAARPSGATAPAGRVRAMLSPKQDGAPAAPAPAATLRPSTTLQGVPQ